MEQRKIMALGKSSLVVSLPKNWINCARAKIIMRGLQDVTEDSPDANIQFLEN